MEKSIERLRVMPVGVIETAEDALSAAEALQEGGLPILEITLRTPAALAAISAVRKTYPEMIVGAGTILTPRQAREAQEAGAMFGVSPGLNAEVVRTAQELNMLFIPGVMTPTEVEKALALGCRLQKFFPAQQAGGAAMLAALSGPYASTGVRFIPLGGINPATAAAYLRLPVVAAVGGSWLVDKQIIAEKNWKKISALAREAVALAQTKGT
jgi:2-dehydro-3-deoxyphosphogluconate aldolase/(4S)-4-hydroxy-2-oxoglutarate aldolase